MNDFAGVDPQRVRLLANKLKDLADALQREAPNIKRLFDGWKGTINQSLLSQQVTQVRTDASDMSKRADQAANLLHSPRITAQGDPHADWVTLPWDVSKINTTVEAQQEAIDLKNAMDHPNDPSSRATIKEVAQSLADHQDDPAYLQAFMGNGGMDQAARAARVLHGQDGTHDSQPLGKDSEAILAQFGQGVQAATSMAAAEPPKITLPPDALKKLTDPAGGDMWSVGMLFKYGPSGATWDPTVLSSVGGAMLDWRKTHQVRPDYSAPVYPYSAGGYVDDKDAWYRSLGINVNYLDSGGDHYADMQSIDANDPSMILMQRVSQNADASRQLLTGPQGADHAAVLVSNKWHTPGNDFDDAKWPAAVITAATLDRKNNPKLSAEAAANLVNAGAAEYDKEAAENEYDQSQYPTAPADITQSLSQVFAAYVPDFAYSTDGKNGDGAYPIQPDPDGPPMIHVSRDTMKNFFAEVMRNHAAGDTMVNSVNAQVAMTFAGDPKSPLATAYLSDLAELRGEMSVAGQKVKYDPAARTDADHARDIMWLNAVGGFVASVPTNNVPADFVKAAIWGGLPLASSAFSTNNAATVDDNAQTTVFDDYAQMRVSVVQGLVASGKVQPPPNHPEWANGAITFRPGTSDQQDFEGWWTGIAQKDPDIENLYKTNMGNGFQSGSVRFDSH